MSKDTSGLDDGLEIEHAIRSRHIKQTEDFPQRVMRVACYGNIPGRGFGSASVSRAEYLPSTAFHLSTLFSLADHVGYTCLAMGPEQGLSVAAAGGQADIYAKKWIYLIRKHGYDLLAGHWCYRCSQPARTNA